MSETPTVPHLHEEPDAWHRHSDEEGMPQSEHAATVNPTALGIVFVVMVIGVAFVILLLTAYFNQYTYTFKAAKQEGVPAARQAYETDLAQTRARLSEYGWIDRTAGTVHVPIERAFDTVIEQYQNANAGS